MFTSFPFTQIVLVITGIVIGGVVVWYVAVSDSGTPYELLNPSAMHIKEQDLLVRFQPLRASLLQKYTEQPDFHVGIYFEYLPTGANIVVNNDRAMWPASLIKIPVAMAAMKKIDDGDWQLHNELVILDEDKDSSFGMLYQQPSGTTMTIESLLHATLVDSDNTAHFVLLRNIDALELEEVFLHLGLESILENIKLNPEAETTDNRMTTKMYSIFFRALYNATFLSPESSERMMEFLIQTPDDYLAQSIPVDVRFAHKTGIREEEGVWADSGVVYINRRPYQLTVMIESKDKTKSIDAETVDVLFRDISQEIFTYVQTL